MEQKPTKPLEIEICARRGDNWYTHAGPPVPLIHAQIKDPPYYWGAGRTPEEALGALVRDQPAMFGVQVTDTRVKAMNENPTNKSPVVEVSYDYYAELDARFRSETRPQPPPRRLSRALRRIIWLVGIIPLVLGVLTLETLLFYCKLVGYGALWLTGAKVSGSPIDRLGMLTERALKDWCLLLA